MKTIIKIFYFIVVVLLIPLNVLSQGIEISSGSSIINTGATTIEITNGSIVNNGTYTKGSETLIFSGTTSTATISGTASPTLVVNALTVKPGTQLTLNDGKTLQAYTFNLQSNESGTATFVDAKNSGGFTKTSGGSVNVQQYLTSGRSWYISSPVSDATSNVFNPRVEGGSGNILGYYTEANAGTVLWPEITNTSTPLTVTRGYVTNMASSGNILFTGTLNTGALTTASLTAAGVTSTGFNLIGNPYPSYYDWDNASRTAEVGTSIWYRSKSTGAYLFQTYNSSGGASTNGGTKYIPPMQSFWVKVNAGKTGTIGFSNTYRSHQDQTVATNRLKAPAEDTRKWLRLKVSNGVNADETLIYADANAQNGYDMYDSEKMFVNNAAVPEIYTMLGNTKLAINGFKDIAANQQLTLGFNTTSANTFSIQAIEVKNMGTDTKIILKDELNPNEEFDLTNGSAYTFTSGVVSTPDRFNVIFKSIGVANGINSAIIDEQSVSVYSNANNKISIHCSNMDNEGRVTVCNTIGQILVSGLTTGSTTVINRTFVPGIYLVTVDAGGYKLTKKIAVN